MNILFLCTGNSCRSQMAEGWAKKLYGDKYKFHSAGVEKHGLNPMAVQVMKEVGVDISRHQSKTTNELPVQKMDLVFTVCSDADKSCPSFPGGSVYHVGFDDPPSLTKEIDDMESTLSVYRRVRDEIETFIKNIEEYLERKH